MVPLHTEFLYVWARKKIENEKPCDEKPREAHHRNTVPIYERISIADASCTTKQLVMNPAANNSPQLLHSLFAKNKTYLSSPRKQKVDICIFVAKLLRLKFIHTFLIVILQKQCTRFTNIHFKGSAAKCINLFSFLHTNSR